MDVKKYKVEAFIIPKCSNNVVKLNEVHNEKLSDQISSSQKESDFEDDCQKHKLDEKSTSEFSQVFFKIDEPIYDEIIVPINKELKSNTTPKEKNLEYTKAFFKIEEPIYDEPFVSNLVKINSNNINNNYDMPQNRWVLANSKYQRFGIVAPKLKKRSSSLKSIVEDIEFFDESLHVCGCGCKNDCFNNNQRPEDISDDIFKENWMQRLNSLRKLETLLKDKEVALQSRERLLFKKEKELRILERLVRDKMRQAELYAKRYKKSSSSESIINEKKSLESNCSNTLKCHSKSENSLNSVNWILKQNSKLTEENKIENVIKNLPNSQNSVVSDRLSSKVSTMRSRSKPRQTVKYDDLDSTLSADIGDSSFIVTSKRFDLQSFKRPAAFVRSASVRYPNVNVSEIHSKTEPQVSTSRVNNLTEKHMNQFCNTKEEKMLKKMNENILAFQEKETKFLNYGLIDEQSSLNTKGLDKNKLFDQKRFSYLNLEFRNKTTKLNSSTKERPISWNEDADDWLKKKREAYNLSTQKINIENIAEKENIDKQAKLDKSGKTTKRKQNRKKFSIFR